jgi:transcription elongation factor GreB
MVDDVKNYITPGGYRRLQEELARLWKVERPPVVTTVAWAAGNGDRSENGDYIYGKKRLREIDRRLRFLDKRLSIAEVVNPRAQKNRDKVFFGASVTYAREDDSEVTVEIVGIDETETGRISWISPVARALMGKSVGDTATVPTPKGAETIEIVAIEYPEQ